MAYDHWWWEQGFDHRGNFTVEWNPQQLPPFPIRRLFTPEREEACVVEGRFGVDDLAPVEQWAAARYQRRGEGWVEVVDTELGPWTRAAVWLIDARHPSVCLEAVSREAYARISDALSEEVAGLKRRDRRQRAFGFPDDSFGWTYRNESLHSQKMRRTRPTPGPEEQLDVLIQHEEQRWLDTPNPVLEGRTPRDAARDPDWVASVYELLTWIERCHYSGPDERIGLTACFDPNRLRLTLGIGRAWSPRPL